jgi:hypothetical protein
MKKKMKTTGGYKVRSSMFLSHRYPASRRLIVVFALLACISIGFLGFATPTTTTVDWYTGSSTPSTYGQTVTFEVTVTGVQTPSGKVELYDGTVFLASKDPITSTTMTFAVSTLSAGDHSITAKYGGDVGGFLLYAQWRNKDPVRG